MSDTLHTPHTPRAVTPCDPPQAKSCVLVCSAGESSLQLARDVLSLLLQYEGRAVSVEIKEKDSE